MSQNTLDPTYVVGSKEPSVSYQSTAIPQDWASQFNTVNFFIKQKMLEMQTAMPVKVVKVTPSDSFSGFVDVQPLIYQIAADDSTWLLNTLFRLPFVRLQGGSNAIIIDPVIGDIGIALFASRDISSLKDAAINSAPDVKNPYKPHSYRSYDMSDGIYIGGILNGTPTQFVQFTDTGINITTPGTVHVNGNLSVSGTITNGSVNLTTHVHSDPQGGDVGGPHN